MWVGVQGNFRFDAADRYRFSSVSRVWRSRRMVHARVGSIWCIARVRPPHKAYRTAPRRLVGDHPYRIPSLANGSHSRGLSQGWASGDRLASGRTCSTPDKLSYQARNLSYRLQAPLCNYTWLPWPAQNLQHWTLGKPMSVIMV